MFEDLKDGVADEVRQQLGQKQTPRLKTDGWEGKDLLLFAPATRTTVISDTVKKMMLPDSATQQTPAAVTAKEKPSVKASPTAPKRTPSR